MNIKKIFWFFIFVFSLFFTNCFADLWWFEIDDYYVVLDLHNDGSMTVNEKIEVNFLEERHWIYRDIQTQYFVGETWFQIFVSNAMVKNFDYKNTDWYEDFSIRIWSADKFVKGKQTYEISYDVYGGVKKFSGYQELYWNLIWDERKTRIKHFNFEVNFNKEFSGIQVDDFFMYHWLYWLTDTWDMNSSYNSKGVYGEVFVPLEAEEAFTIWVKFPKDFFDLDDAKQESLLLYQTNNYDYQYNYIPTWGGYSSPIINLPNLIILWIILFVFFFNFFWLYKRNYTKDVRDKKTIIPYYLIPKWISASEAGILVDDKLDARDITALIYTWAANWYITIEEKKWQWKFSKKEYILNRTDKKVREMKSYEEYLFNKMFKKRKSFNLKNSSTFTSYVKHTINKLESYILSQQYYKIKSIKNKPNKTPVNIMIFVFFGFLANVTLVFWIAEWIFDYYQIQLNDALILLDMLLGFIMFVWLFFMPKQEFLTEKWVKLRYELLGFKLFLEKVEVKMLKTFLKEDPLYFDKILPYAVVFGLQTQFIAKITPLLKEAPEWYNWDFNHFQTTLNSTVLALNKASHYTPPRTYSTSYSSSSGFSSSSSSFSSSSGWFSGWWWGWGGGWSW